MEKEAVKFCIEFCSFFTYNTNIENVAEEQVRKQFSRG